MMTLEHRFAANMELVRDTNSTRQAKIEAICQQYYDKLLEDDMRPERAAIWLHGQIAENDIKDFKAMQKAVASKRGLRT